MQTQQNGAAPAGAVLQHTSDASCAVGSSILHSSRCTLEKPRRSVKALVCMLTSVPQGSRLSAESTMS